MDVVYLFNDCFGVALIVAKFGLVLTFVSTLISSPTLGVTALSSGKLAWDENLVIGFTPSMFILNRFFLLMELKAPFGIRG